MATYGIKIHPERSRVQVADEIDGCRLRIDVTEAQGLSDHVFVYLTRPLDPRNTAELVADFHKVASSTDLETIPEGLPYPNSNPPWFRLNYIDLVFACDKHLVDALDAVKDDLATLINTLEVLDRLNATGDLVYGDLSGSSSSEGG